MWNIGSRRFWRMKYRPKSTPRSLLVSDFSKSMFRSFGVRSKFWKMSYHISWCFESTSESEYTSLVRVKKTPCCIYFSERHTHYMHMKLQAPICNQWIWIHSQNANFDFVENRLSLLHWFPNCTNPIIQTFNANMFRH